MKALLPYQRKRIRSTERYIENLRDRLTRAPLDVAWACRGGAVLQALMIREARRRRGDIRLVEEIRHLADDVPHSLRADLWPEEAA